MQMNHQFDHAGLSGLVTARRPWRRLQIMVGGLAFIWSVLAFADWPLHGEDTFEQRQSPLTQIHPDNIQDARPRLVFRHGYASRARSLAHCH